MLFSISETLLELVLGSARRCAEKLCFSVPLDFFEFDLHLLKHAALPLDVRKEIAHARVVAVTENGFTPEMFFEMLEFLFDIGKLRLS